MSKSKKELKEERNYYRDAYEELQDSYIFGYDPIVIDKPDNPAIVFEKDLLTNASSERNGKNIPEEMMLDPIKDNGFYFGKRYLKDNRYVGKPQDADGHIMILGSPGSGKTSCIFIPSLMSLDGHIVVIDVKPKSSLLEQCRLTGKDVLVFNPYEDDSCGYDPFTFIRADDENNLARNAKELALSLLSIIPSGNDRIWVELAQNLLTGFIIYHINLGLLFEDTMIILNTSSVEDIIATINESSDELAKMFIIKLNNLKSEVLAGIGMDLVNLAIFAADPIISKALSNSKKTNMIDWNILNTSSTPSIIVLQLPEENLGAWEPMTKLLINQLIRTLMRRDDKYNKNSKSLPPVLVMLDEFASLGEITLIKTGLSTLRSRGVTFCLAIQDISQLDALYGVYGRKTIIGTCTYKVILKVDELESMEYFSKLTGSVIVPSRSVSASCKSDSSKADNFNLQVSGIREPVMFPHEFMTLKDVVLITPDGYFRVEKVPYYQLTEQPDVVQEPQVVIATRIY